MVFIGRAPIRALRASKTVKAFGTLNASNRRPHDAQRISVPAGASREARTDFGLVVISLWFFWRRGQWLVLSAPSGTCSSLITAAIGWVHGGELEDFHFFHFTTEAIKRTALVQRELLTIDGSMGWEGKCRTPALFVQWF
jgi:hypothetical protein